MLRKNIKIDRQSMELISLFNNISGAIIKDCFIFQSPENNTEIIIFLVKKEDVGKAIGKAGEHVKDLMTKLQKKIDVIPWSDNLGQFIQFILNTTKNSIQLQNIEIKESRN
ncbi:MAG: KH domain-containing protein [Candidatus Hermodarchaeota archaeon]